MISKIIDELSDSKESLVNPLLKTKVLATRLKNQGLLQWVTNELDGYNTSDDDDDIPNYRIAKANTNCNIQIGYNIRENTPIPISYIENEEFRAFFQKFHLLDGVQALESYVNKPNGDTLGKKLPIDFWQILTHEIQKSGAKISITNVSITTHLSSITQTLSEIRTKFLDLMLKLEEEYPDLKNIQDESKKEKEEINEKITIIMKQINIENKGKGNSINTGDNSQIATGKNIKQKNIINTTDLKKVENLLKDLKDSIAKYDFEDKEDLELEVTRIENQLNKEEPKSEIVLQSLDTIKSFLLSIAANVWTQPLIEGIQSIMV